MLISIITNKCENSLYVEAGIIVVQYIFGDGFCVKNKQFMLYKNIMSLVIIKSLVNVDTERILRE